MNTFATRTRPYTCPHPTTQLQVEARKSREEFHVSRKDRIAELVKSASPDNNDEFYWTMIYDLEMAPETTGRAQLLEFGIIPAPPQELFTPSDLHDELWTVLEALSKCGIYFINTDHLNDANLYARLYYRILDEPCKMMPSESACVEYIDVLHPMDLAHPIGQSMERRKEIKYPKTYKRSAICSLPGVLSTRDKYLPRPA